MFSFSPKSITEFYILNTSGGLGSYPALLVSNDSNVIYKVASGGKYDDVARQCHIDSFE